MARYDFKCADGHVNEVTVSMAEIDRVEVQCATCGKVAERVFQVPAAIHFKGPGFYSTDVKGRLERKRRRNVADDLPKEHDRGAARIADAI